MKIIFGSILVVLFFSALGLSFLLYKKNSLVPNLGHEQGVLQPLPKSPNAVSSQTDDAARKVETLPFKGGISETHSKLVAVIESFERSRVVKRDPNYIRAVFTSRLFRFNDDVEFYLDEADQVVHFRSASRAGKSDMGVNRQRFNEISERYLKLE